MDRNSQLGALRRAQRERAQELHFGGGVHIVDPTVAAYWPTTTQVPDHYFIEDSAPELCERAKRRLLYADRCGCHHAFPFDEITTLVIAAAYTESVQRAESALEGR